MILTGTSLITDSLVKLQVLRFGQPAAPDLLAGGLGVLNDLIDSLLLEEMFVFSIEPDAYPLTGALSYTIGPTGDFHAQRPTRIENANYIFATISPVVRKEVAILTAAEWSLISVQNILTNVIQAIWYEGDVSQPDGNATIHVWPGGTAGNQLELFTWKQLLSFADLVTPYTFPPGYSEALKWILAEKLLPSVTTYLKGDKQFLTMIADQAQKGRTAIMSYNSRDIMTMIDPAYLVGGRRMGGWSYLTGSFGRSL